MTLSIIVPVYNAAPYLKRCLDSLPIRDDVEVIVIDDGSTDDSWNTCLKDMLAKHGRKAAQFAKNRGVSAARNEGIKMATGEFISFLDADDEYAPGALNAINASIRMYPDAELIQMNHMRGMQSGVTVPRMFNAQGKYDLYNLPKLWMSSCNKLFRADLIEDIRFDESLRHGEDELFVLECLRRTRCIYNSEHIALHYHKENPNSLSTTTSFDDLLGEQRALLDFLDKYRDDGEITFAIRQRMTELWNNAVYKRTFGG